MKDLVLLAGKIGPAGVPVLIAGETGTGKEVVAELIHANSERRGKPMVCINCAGLPADLIESELFGSTKGSFTGSIDRIGLLASAVGSTVFLDELSEMPLNLQSKLLRFLQDMNVRRVGSNTGHAVNVRVIAAVNQSPAICMQEKRLREDLYYRLSTVALTVPPLRDRIEDIVPLAEAYVAYYAALLDRPKPALSLETKAVLRNYAWPGNVRQLQNEMNRAVLLGDNGCISPVNLAFYQNNTDPLQVSVTVSINDLSPLEKVEIKAVVDTLKACKWNMLRASTRLGIGRQTLYSKVKRYGIKRPKWYERAPRRSRHSQPHNESSEQKDEPAPLPPSAFPAPRIFVPSAEAPASKSAARGEEGFLD